MHDTTPAPRPRLADLSACLVLAVALATATVPAQGTASPAETGETFPVQVGPVEGLAALEPADPRTPALAAHAPDASQGLLSGEVHPSGATLDLVHAETFSLGLLWTDAGPQWVTVEDGTIVPAGVDEAQLAGTGSASLRGDTAPTPDERASLASSSPSPKDGVLQIALEGDFEYWQRFRSTWDTYQLRVIHLVSSLYEHQVGVPFEVTDQRISTSGDQPVTGDEICEGFERDVLDQFRLYREEHSPTTASVREAAHLFTSKTFRGTTTIGCAFISEIDTHAAYGVSQVINQPARDVSLVAHEIGHNFDGEHFRALPTPNGTADAGDCDQPASVMYPCVGDGDRMVFTRTAADQHVPWEGAELVRDGGNLPHMVDYSHDRT